VPLEVGAALLRPRRRPAAPELFTRSGARGTIAPTRAARLDGGQRGVEPAQRAGQTSQRPGFWSGRRAGRLAQLALHLLAEGVHARRQIDDRRLRHVHLHSGGVDRHRQISGAQVGHPLRLLGRGRRPLGGCGLCLLEQALQAGHRLVRAGLREEWLEIRFGVEGGERLVFGPVDSAAGGARGGLVP